MKIQRNSRGCLVTAILSVCVASCNEINPAEPLEKQIQITADNEAFGTRTQIDNGAAYGITGIMWSPEDRIGVFGNVTVNAEFTSTNSKPAVSATFSGTADVPQYAYYPYSENAGTDPANVRLGIAAEQNYYGDASISANDLKVTNAATSKNGNWHFTFRPVVTMLHFEVNTVGTVIGESEKLTAIQIGTGADPIDGICGAYTIDLTDGNSVLQPVDGESGNILKVKLPGQPALSSSVEAYACIAPVIEKDDVISIILFTDRHKASFKVKALQTLAAGSCYSIPLNLANASEQEHGLVIEDYDPAAAPRLLSFKFTVAGNEGKILGTEAYYNPSKGTETRSVSEQTMTISESDTNGNWLGTGSVNACIPYLYNFELIPTFTTSPGALVTVNGVDQTSGKSMQDFSGTVTYTVTNGIGESRDYEVTLTNSGLPVVVLSGGGASGVPGDKEFLGTTIPSKSSDFVNTDKIAIYDRAGGQNMTEAACGFRLRGNSTQNYPKKPLAIKLDKKAEVLGMPKHKRWVLLASWIDRSLIRNAVAFDIAHTIEEAFTSTPDADLGYGAAGCTDGADGTNGLVWNPHGKNVELVLNGVHAGNYLLAEQIKIDKNRLAIQDGYEDVLEGSQDVTNPGAAPTISNCGYLLEFDDNYDEPTKFMTEKAFLPCMSKDDMTHGGSVISEIWNYVQNYIQDIEDKLWSGNYAEAYEKLDINSVIDYWFVQELTMNDEFKHPKSVYMYKNGEGKLYAGPVWDFDWQTFPEIANIANWDPQYGLDYGYSTLLYTKGQYGSSESGYRSDRPYMWYPKLFNDPNFKARVKKRWAVVYPLLQNIPAKIEALGAKNSISAAYDETMWPAESYERSNWSGISVAYSGDEKLGSYDEVIDQMVRVYNIRLDAMNSAINSL